MAMTAGQIAQINKMNKASQRAALGTAVGNLETSAAALALINVKGGSLTVTAGMDTANTTGNIATGLGRNITGFIVQVYRADILQASIKVTANAANLVVLDNSTTYVLTTGDVIKWLVW
jgi:hypothetical protein